MRTCILRADIEWFFFGIMFVLFCFVSFSFFFFNWSRGPSFHRSLFFNMHAPRQPLEVAAVCAFSRFCFFLVLFLWRCRLSRVFLYHYRFSLCVWRVRRTLFPSGWCLKKSQNAPRPSEHPPVLFYLVTTGWVFDISLLCENSIKKKANTLLL